MEASVEESWRDSLSATTIITFREAHDSLFQGESARYSAFATRVMINALFLEVWYHKRSPEALQDVVTEYKLRLALETWEKSLLGHLDTQSLRFRYASIYGQLVTEWLSDKNKGVAAASEDVQMGESYEDVGSAQKLAARQAWEDLVFEPAEVDVARLQEV